jgi:hypothetical protein
MASSLQCFSFEADAIKYYWTDRPHGFLRTAAKIVLFPFSLFFYPIFLVSLVLTLVSEILNFFPIVRLPLVLLCLFFQRFFHFVSLITFGYSLDDWKDHESDFYQSHSY